MTDKKVIETKKIGDDWVASLKVDSSKIAKGSSADKAFENLCRMLGASEKDYRHHEQTE